MTNPNWGNPIKYTVFVGADSHVVEFPPYQPLSDFRKKLTEKGLITDKDAFLYENPATKLKTVFTPRSSEKNYVLGTAKPHSQAGAAFPSVPSQHVDNPIVQVVSISKSSPSLMGTTPSDGWLRPNQEMGMRCRLNDSDPAAIKNNKGMFQPLMLENVQSANPDDPADFTYCVVTQKGAIVSFDVSSWGAAGIGYTITSAMGTAINPEGLFTNYDPGHYDRQTWLRLDRYVGDGSKTGDTIQMEANSSMHIAKQYNVEYSTLVFKAWSLKSWEDSSGKKYSSGTPVPSEVLIGDSADNGFQPGPPSGNGSVPGGTTSSGSPKAGPPSKQRFGSIYAPSPGSPPATRSGGLTGALQVYFFVFKNDHDAKTVMRVLNAGTMGFG